MSFNFTKSIRLVCNDICMRVPQFSHINMDKVGISFSQTRNIEKHGVYASLRPLKFQNGANIEKRNDSYWFIPDIYGENKVPVLYLLSFYLPRFLNLSLMEKLNTIVHELYHIGQHFDGDIRRFEGRCYAHGTSRKQYNLFVQKFVQEWLEKDPPPAIWDFLKLNFAELAEKHNGVFGARIMLPRIRRISMEEAQRYLKQNR